MLRRILAITVSAVTMLAMTLAPTCVFAAGDDVDKDETVYVITDTTGSQNEVIVSDHLKNASKSDTIEDKTNLTDIENVKGDEDFEKGDTSFITWNAGGNDIYYQGRTNKQVPVTMHVTYTLNGKNVGGEKLKGKSGDLTIKIVYTNNTSYNGTKVPFIVMSGFIVQDGCFKDITIDHGKVIDDGEKEMVVGIAAPGLADTLGISGNKIGLTDSIEIRGKAEDFEVDDIMTVVTSGVFNELSGDEIGDLDFDDEIDALDKGTKELVKGSKLLYEGLNKVDENMPELMQGAAELDKGAKELGNSLMVQMDDMITGLTKLEAAASGIKTKVDSQIIPGLSNIANSLEGAAESLDDNDIPEHAASVAQYLAALKDAQNVISAHHDSIKAALIADGMSEEKANMLLNTANIDGVAAESAAVSLALNGDGTNTLPAKLETAAGKIEAVVGKAATEEEASTGLHSLSDGLGDADHPQTLIGGLDKLKSSLSEATGEEGELSNGLKQLTYGTGELMTGTQKLGKGITKLDKGSLQLSQGMSKLYNEGIKKLVDLYNDDLKGLTSGLRNMMDAAEDYQTFTLLPPGMTGATKFIYKTPITE